MPTPVDGVRATTAAAPSGDGVRPRHSVQTRIVHRTFSFEDTERLTIYFAGALDAGDQRGPNFPSRIASFPLQGFTGSSITLHGSSLTISQVFQVLD